ncbi:MAG: universal stress protein [Chthoniobacterales bacterium]
MKMVLVPVDFSDSAGGLLAAAAEEAGRREAGLFLLHVIEPVAGVAGFETDPEMMRLSSGTDFENEKRIETAQVRELASKVQAQGLACESAVRFGLPADEIIAAAGECNAELIVMGSHGHGALYHLFTGSVVNGVLKHALCPVLVVPLRLAGR